MAKLNPHYRKLPRIHFHREIEQRISAFKEKQPRASLLHLGTGDITHPIPLSAASALTKAVEEMSITSYGYGPSQGYPFLREAIAKGDYGNLGISPNEIFISDGAKSDLANLQEIFDLDNRIALLDPTYPLYLNTNVMAGRTRLLLKSGAYGGVTYLPCTEENAFCPSPPSSPVDLIYLCSPNNPTGVAMDRALLREWVEYARESEAVILFDGAYEAYIQSPGIPRSIYEIEGAKEVAIEVRSFSKSAGFTGVRCSYTVIPHALCVRDVGGVHSLHALWTQRQEAKFHGVPYPVQRAAAALYTSAGKKEREKIIRSHHERAALLREGLQKLGFSAFGGIDAPYVWWKTPGEWDSWSFFHLLLEKAHLVAAPGRGFGLSGEGFVRLSACADKAALIEGLSRLKKIGL